jgi:anti-sigma regulatory factor (Ser/Thr protein kinase)
MPRPLPDVAAGYPVPRPGAATETTASQRLVLRGRPEQVGVARAFVRQVLGGSHPALERATLLASELVTNSVSHSNSRLAGGTITVTVRTAEDRVRIEVTDDGGPTEPAVCRDDELAETGRGLQLVQAYSLGWGFHRIGPRAVTWVECLPEPLALVNKASVRAARSASAFPRWASPDSPAGRRR